MRRSIVVAALCVAVAVSLSGCMWEFASGSGSVTGAQFLAGTVTGTPITGSYTAVITGASPSPDPNCSNLSLVVTMTDAAGNTVTKEEAGVFCPIVGGGFTGQYTVTGGTGIYEGATGSGTSTMQITGGARGVFTFTSQEIGTFQVPDTASATSGRKMFKMRGTLRFGTKPKDDG